MRRWRVAANSRRRDRLPSPRRPIAAALPRRAGRLPAPSRIPHSPRPPPPPAPAGPRPRLPRVPFPLQRGSPTERGGFPLGGPGMEKARGSLSILGPRPGLRRQRADRDRSPPWRFPAPKQPEGPRQGPTPLATEDTAFPRLPSAPCKADLSPEHGRAGAEKAHCQEEKQTKPPRVHIAFIIISPLLQQNRNTRFH